MADLTTQNITIAAPELDLVGSLAAAAVGGDTAEITPNSVFVLNNGSAGTITATFATPGTVNGLAIAEATMAVLAGDVGVMPLANVFRQSTGRANVTYSGVTTVTVGVFKIGA
jgi:hypothetical protein